MKIYKFNEPRLKFAYNQILEDPRDGLTVFGPFDKDNVNNFSVGIIGTNQGVIRMRNWLKKINKPIYHPIPDIAYPFFPGFEEVFHVKINQSVIPELIIDEKLLNLFYRYDDSHVRVSEIVDLYIDKLLSFINEGEKLPNVWFIVIPDEIYSVCRPKSYITGKNIIKVGIKSSFARIEEGMFDNYEQKKWRESYDYENHFHNQLKIKLLKHRIITQIVKERTIAYHEYNNVKEKKLEVYLKQQTAIVWNISTALYYKIGGLPWKLSDIRDKVCYIGLTYKQDNTKGDPRFACCAAQMFLDSGDGMVFRGRVGPYYNVQTKEYHLTKEIAKELLQRAIESFQKVNKYLPTEIFIHGKTNFNDEEWSGFSEAVPNTVNLVGIRIKSENTFKLYRYGDFPILRGSALIKNKRSAFLWTKGFIPRIQSILGLETPNPLNVQIIRGYADISTVCKDILSLTKLNYNACIFCDGQPVTLKFSDTIGEILTAGPNENLEILPFKYYI
ncbi:MAG: hypothetical protein JST55_05180 [Bacteroidetes bacterium]|nr:hypothetical protein [Bacteroidota bacterium]